MTSAIDLRQHEQLLRADADRAQRVDLLGDLHRADLRRVGRSGAAGDDDRGQQRRQLAQHRERDQVDDEDVGAEALQLVGALVGDHDAHQERQQAGDRQRLDARRLHVVQDRPPAQPARIAAARAAARARSRRRTPGSRRRRRPTTRAARRARARAAGGRRALERDLARRDQLQQRRELRAQPCTRRAAARCELAHGPVQQPGAGRVERGDAGPVDDDLAALRPFDFGQPLVQIRDRVGRPDAATAQFARHRAGRGGQESQLRARIRGHCSIQSPATPTAGRSTHLRRSRAILCQRHPGGLITAKQMRDSRPRATPSRSVEDRQRPASIFGRLQAGVKSKSSRFHGHLPLATIGTPVHDEGSTMDIERFMQGYKAAWERRDERHVRRAVLGRWRVPQHAFRRAARPRPTRRLLVPREAPGGRPLGYEVLASTATGGIAHWHVTYQVASEELFRIWAAPPEPT